MLRSTQATRAFPEGEQFPENTGQTAAQGLSTMQKNGERAGPEKEELSTDKAPPATEDCFGMEFCSKWHLRDTKAGKGPNVHQYVSASTKRGIHTNEILTSFKKEGNSDTCYKMDEP